MQKLLADRNCRFCPYKKESFGYILKPFHFNPSNTPCFTMDYSNKAPMVAILALLLFSLQVANASRNLRSVPAKHGCDESNENSKFSDDVNQYHIMHQDQCKMKPPLPPPPKDSPTPYIDHRFGKRVPAPRPPPSPPSAPPNHGGDKEKSSSSDLDHPFKKVPAPGPPPSPPSPPSGHGGDNEKSSPYLDHPFKKVPVPGPSPSPPSPPSPPPGHGGDNEKSSSSDLDHQFKKVHVPGTPSSPPSPPPGHGGDNVKSSSSELDHPLGKRKRTPIRSPQPSPPPPPSPKLGGDNEKSSFYGEKYSKDSTSTSSTPTMASDKSKLIPLLPISYGNEKSGSDFIPTVPFYAPPIRANP